MPESDVAHAISLINIEDEMRRSYMDYAMSVIVGRALPDVRDGLKPVHRRVLYAMNEMGNAWNKAHKKSARVVGDVIGKYHPHGDTAIYDTIVRMAQPFSLRYVLVDGQGNFGSIDGDSPAAMRYTEVRMSRIAQELLTDIDKETVDFSVNYDGSEKEPNVLPARIPNLLINGSSGIAVGMATNIPPHNLVEVLNACIHLVRHPKASIDELIALIPGPDFPTFGMINGVLGIQEAYRTGRGKIYIRARCHIEEDEDGANAAIVITELPYQVNKARLLEKIAELVKEKKLTGIRELRDESDKEGIRVVIELRRNEVAEVILNNLYKCTQLQTVFGINIVALADGQPKLMNLKELLEAFLGHRREIITRRALFDLHKARTQAHLLEGLAVAFANIDPVIALIKKATGPAEARKALLDTAWDPGIVVDMLKKTGTTNVSRPEDLATQYGLVGLRYHLSPLQAQAILDLRLQKLTNIEQSKLIQEFNALLDKITDLLDLLSSPERLSNTICEEMEELKKSYGDARRTTIITQHQDLNIEDLITEQEVIVTLSHKGYAKLQPVDVYRSQRRGGKGKKATVVKEDDFIDQLFIANTHATILCFSSLGKVYWLKVYALPKANRTARGQPIINMLPLTEGERISTILPVRTFSEDKYVFMVTNDGTVKKTALSQFSRPRQGGIRAIELSAGNQLIDVKLTDGKQDVMLFSNTGKAIRFNESKVRAVGRTAKGVRGIRLADKEQVVSLIIVENEGAILTATENGYGKRTPITSYRTQGRGGSGIISIQTSDRNGDAVGAVLVQEEDEIMLISNQGKLIRSPVCDISIVSRNTQGVRLVNLSNQEQLAGVAPVFEDGEEKT